MRQRLLLDENLSERLLPLLIETFPESTHVRPVGLGGASDTEIWQWARLHGAILVTKDEDFLRLSVARGIPPKVALPGDRQCKQCNHRNGATSAGKGY